MNRYGFLSVPLRVFLLFIFLLKLYSGGTGFMDPLQGRYDTRDNQYSYSLLTSDYYCHVSGLMEKARNVLNTTPHFNKAAPPRCISDALILDRQIESNYSQYTLFSVSSIDCLEGPALVFPFHCFT